MGGKGLQRSAATGPRGLRSPTTLRNADGTHVLTFHQAGDVDKALARGQADTPTASP